MATLQAVRPTGSVGGTRPAATPTLSVRLRPNRSAPASARRLVRMAGRMWHLPETQVDEAASVAGALVFTSVCQARSCLELILRISDGCFLVEVRDSLDRFPLVADAEHVPIVGFDYVRRLAAESGFERLPGGRRLWARIEDLDRLLD